MEHKFRSLGDGDVYAIYAGIAKCFALRDSHLMPESVKSSMQLADMTRVQSEHMLCIPRCVAMEDPRQVPSSQSGGTRTPAMQAYEESTPNA